MDWEVELAVVIGARATLRRRRGDALAHVAGFALHNDYSERAFQLERGGQWAKGKSADTLRAPRPVSGHARRDARLRGARACGSTVNGEMRQQSSTADMIFDVPTLVSYVSQFMTLLPGDVISTGTPAGVGLGMKPPRLPEARRRGGARHRRPG